jgi:hypothetical protein
MSAYDRWKKLEASLKPTPMRLQAVQYLADTNAVSPYDASRAGLCSPAAITKWGIHNVMDWVAIYKEAHPDAVAASEHANRELLLLLDDAVEMVKGIVRDDPNVKGTTAQIRMALYTIDYAFKKGAEVREVRAAAQKAGIVAQEDELDSALRNVG